MKILIIENDHKQKHKIWKLLCMATTNDMEMDFVSGSIDDYAKDETFNSISVDLENCRDIYGLQAFLHYWMEHEHQSNKEESEDDDI